MLAEQQKTNQMLTQALNKPPSALETGMERSRHRPVADAARPADHVLFRICHRGIQLRMGSHLHVRRPRRRGSEPALHRAA